MFEIRLTTEHRAPCRKNREPRTTATAMRAPADSAATLVQRTSSRSPPGLRLAPPIVRLRVSGSPGIRGVETVHSRVRCSRLIEGDSARHGNEVLACGGGG
jgi:hypothetical protein